MRAQVGKRSVVIKPVGLLQLFKHARHAPAAKAGIAHHAKTHTIGFALHVARKIQLALRRKRLPTNDGGRAGIGIFAGRQRAQHHRGNHPRRLLGLLGDQPRNMPLGDMAHFMGQHRGQFIRIGHSPHQAQMHPKVATRQGKGIDAAVANQEKLPGKALFKLCRQFAACAGGGH